jgi:membrane-associated phospholipid phosphatase
VLRGHWKLVPWVFVVLNGVARVYVGAHNPLAVIGGAGLGLVIGGLLNVLVAPVESSDEATDALEPIPTS